MFVGVDVHTETIAVAVAEAVRELGHRVGPAKRVVCGYEAGPCG